MKNPLANVKPMNIGITLLTGLWALFQWRDPTPPPVLDQILVAAMGVWFANQAIDRKAKGSARRKVTVDKDGNVSVSEIPDDEADDADATDSTKDKDSG
jgi:xanthosine utilization system XapX-like protein